MEAGKIPRKREYKWITGTANAKIFVIPYDFTPENSRNFLTRLPKFV